MPASNINFLDLSSPFSFKATNIKTAPNKKKVVKGDKNKIEPLNISLTAGTIIWTTIQRKLNASSQNITNVDFFTLSVCSDKWAGFILVRFI